MKIFDNLRKFLVHGEGSVDEIEKVINYLKDINFGSKTFEGNWKDFITEKSVLIILLNSISDSEVKRKSCLVAALSEEVLYNNQASPNYRACNCLISAASLYALASEKQKSHQFFDKAREHQECTNPDYLTELEKEVCL
ncbi:MAG: hypothetical protein ABIG37_01115 [Nanoarchaeota archaeon]|nr:hypothetical protein [Nanoarchaeota archaeon]